VLWRDRQFGLFWGGQTVSVLGSAVTALALPLMAEALLGATAWQMGLLGAAQMTPHLLFGLLAGVAVDRWPRRRTMIAADLGRAALLALVPLAWSLGWLSIELLYAVAFGIGGLSLLFDVASTSFVPSLVGRERLVEGNAQVALSGSVASTAGRGLGGALVQLLGAPLAIALDAASFLVSAASLAMVRVAEPSAAAPAARRGLWADVVEGLRTVFGDAVLRAMTIGSAIGSLALQVQAAVLVLYLRRQLGLEPAVIGAIFATASAAGIVGALLAGRGARLIGAGPSVVYGTLLTALGTLAAPLAGGPTWLVVAVLLLGQLLIGIGGPIYAVNQLSVRQLVTPDHLLGRVNASRRFLVFGVGPVGALLGGAVGEAAGLPAALLLGAGLMLIAFAWLFASPLRDGYAGANAALSMPK
jgi:MFS family permease